MVCEICEGGRYHNNNNNSERMSLLSSSLREVEAGEGLLLLSDEDSQQFSCAYGFEFTKICSCGVVNVVPSAAERQALQAKSNNNHNHNSKLGKEEQLVGEESSPFILNSESILKIIKYTYSLGLLFFCLYLIVSGIWAEETPIAMLLHPVAALVIMCLLIFWLGVTEGGQGCLVGLQPIEKELYSQTHPRACLCATLAHEGENLNRFIIGRQFLVVIVVFCLNLCCTTVENAVDVPGVSPAVAAVVLESGLAVMLITVMLGQLSAEVTATNCMLDFVNCHVVYATTLVCLAIESSGLLHSVYIVPDFMKWITTKKLSCRSNKPSSSKKKNNGTKAASTRTDKERTWYWIRVLCSFVILALCFVVTMSAILNEKTAKFQGLPVSGSVIIFFGLICFLGMLEAMQIALFAVVNLPESDLDEYPVAQQNCRLAFRGNNFQAFLIGRQICVTMSMFLLARFTTTEVDVESNEETVLGMGVGLQLFFNTGLPGALITTIVASLVWRIVASTSPIPFMANPLVYPTIRLCLVLEASGVFSASWLLADMLKSMVGFELDEVYLGAMGQRGHGKIMSGEDEATEGSSVTDSSSSESDAGSNESPVVMGYGSVMHQSSDSLTV
ncbi:hypothetical protein ACA910_016286 [Epithemia clementina (nom. ined.)]